MSSRQLISLLTSLFVLIISTINIYTLIHSRGAGITSVYNKVYAYRFHCHIGMYVYTAGSCSISTFFCELKQHSHTYHQPHTSLSILPGFIEQSEKTHTHSHAIPSTFWCYKYECARGVVASEYSTVRVPLFTVHVGACASFSAAVKFC